MRINDQNSAGISSSQLGRTEAAHTTGRPGRPGGPGAGGDQVELSSLAGSLRAATAESPERVEYLQKLAADIKTGRYQVDAAELSRKIVDSALTERG